MTTSSSTPGTALGRVSIRGWRPGFRAGLATKLTLSGFSWLLVERSLGWQIKGTFFSFQQLPRLGLRPLKGAVSAQKALHFHLAHGRLGTTEPNLDCVVAKNLILDCKTSTVKL